MRFKPAFIILLGLFMIKSIPAHADYADIHGLKMYYEIRGSGPDLVLLHGGASSIKTTFGNIIDDLARTHRVIGIEQQGHGHTADIKDRPFDFATMADDTAALLEKINVKDADVFGFSNGGNVAMQLAIRHPALVRRIIIGSAFYKSEGIYPPVREFFKQPLKVENFPKPLQEDFAANNPQPENMLLQGQKIMAMLNGFKDWPDSDIQSIKVPALVLIGDQDIITPEHAAAMMRLLPKGRLVVLPGLHGQYIGEATTTPITPEMRAAMLIILNNFLSI